MALAAEREAIVVTMVGPPVCVDNVLQGTTTVLPGVEEHTLDLLELNTLFASMTRIREMPPTTTLNTVAIIVVVMVANRKHAFGPAGLQDAHPVHSFAGLTGCLTRRTNLHAVKFVALELHLVPRLRGLGTVSITILVVAVPSMCTASILQTSCVVNARVEVRILQRLVVYTMLLVMVWVREMPPGTGVGSHTLAIVVRNVVTYRGELSVSFACNPDVLRTHHTLHCHPCHVVREVAEIRWLWGLGRAECVHVCILAASPSVRAASVLQRTNMVMTCVKERTGKLCGIDPSPPCMRRVAKVPVSKGSALAIIVVRMIAHRSKTLRLTCFENIRGGHVTFDNRPLDLEVLVVEVERRNVCLPLRANSGAILVMVGVSPSVCGAQVLQRSSPMRTGVEKQAFHRSNLDSMLLVMDGI